MTPRDEESGFASAHDAGPRVRVLLVEDSATELYLLRKLFELAPDLQIVGEARNGQEALELLEKVRPDLVCTDYHMPVMDGMEFILRARKISTCPIMVLSVAVQAHQKDNIFRLLAAGALTVLAKPAGTAAGITRDEGHQLFETIRALARSAKQSGPRAPGETPSAASGIARIAPAVSSTPDLSGAALVAIGASTGGPQILAKIFAQLPAALPVPVVCVQHISAGFLPGLVNWLQHECKLAVEIAEHKGIAQPGRIYFAPDGMDLTMGAGARFILEAGNATRAHCPGIDPLFASVAREYGVKGVGILLSGMGRDGASGLKAMRDAGATTIAQNEATSVIFGMPGAAIALGAARHILSTDEIALAMSAMKKNR